ncbi:MAG: 4'-phosphopantetheinyl transferase superfamily protein, partial [Thermoplasmatota archaeon]
DRAGVDVERVEPRPTAWLDEAFTANERVRLTTPEAATRAWCAKEALLKALGLGLHADLHAVEVSLRPDGRADIEVSGNVKARVAELGFGRTDVRVGEFEPGYAAAVAVAILLR